MPRIDNTNMDTFTLRRLFRRIFAELTFLKKHGGGGGGGGGDTSDKADVTTTIKGVGSLGGGGDLSADRTLDLTQNTKNDIALGVTAHGWGDHGTEGYATETWVDNKGFLTSHQDISGKADKTIKVEGTGSLEGGGDLSENRTLDLTQASKDDIASGVMAHGWGNHATAGYLTTHQDITGKEDKANKVQDLSTPNATTYPSTQAVDNALLKNVKDIPGGAEVIGHTESNSILEKQITENVSGTYTFDPLQASNFNLTLTGTTTFLVGNIPENRSAVFSVVLRGEHAFSFSQANFKPYSDNDVYDGTKHNQIVVHIRRGGSVPRGFYSIKNTEADGSL